MATQLEIINAALDCLGEQIITDVDSTTDPVAIKAKRAWSLALDELLCAAHWNWAKVRTTLNPDSPQPDFGWANIYTLPDDFVSLVGLNEMYVDTPSDLFEVNGYSLLTDETTADIEYIRKFISFGSSSGAADIDDFLAPVDGSSVTALVHLLASKLAPVIAEDGFTKASQFLQLYNTVSLPNARVRNGNLGRSGPRFPSKTSPAIGSRTYWRNS